MSAPAAPVACERCGTFVEPAELRLFRGKRRCAACDSVERRSVGLWGVPLIAVIGTIAPPAGWFLAAADWWRLGQPVRMLLPVAAVVARVASAFLYEWIGPAGAPGAVSAAAWLGLNLASVLGIVYDYKKAIDGADSAKTPPLTSL